MARRKKKQARRRGRHHASAFLAVMLVILAIGGVGVSLFVFFKINSIEVNGSTRYSQRDIIAASGIKMGQNLYSVNTARVSKELCAALPYIKSAKVSLLPFSTVVMDIKADKPCGVIQTGNSFCVVDDGMKVLETGIVPGKGYPLIKGLTAAPAASGETLKTSDSQKLTCLKEIYKALEDNKIDITLINSVDITDTYEITLGYGGRITILVGTSSNMDYKIKVAGYIIKKQLTAKEKGKLDVSDADPGSADAYRMYFQDG